MIFSLFSRVALLSREDSSDKMGDRCMQLQPSSSWARSSGCCSYGSLGGATNNNAAASPFTLHGWDCAKRQLRTLICTRPPSALTSCLFSFPSPPHSSSSPSRKHIPTLTIVFTYLLLLSSLGLLTLLHCCIVSSVCKHCFLP